MLTCTPPEVIQRAHLTRALIDAGVTIDLIARDCIRLHGTHGEVILTNDLLSLKKHEINKLCSAA